MPLGSSSAAPVTRPGPIFERARKTFGDQESKARAPAFGESLRYACFRSGIRAMEDILSEAVLRRTTPIVHKRLLFRDRSRSQRSPTVSRNPRGSTVR